MQNPRSSLHQYKMRNGKNPYYEIKVKWKEISVMRNDNEIKRQIKHEMRVKTNAWILQTCKEKLCNMKTVT